MDDKTRMVLFTIHEVSEGRRRKDHDHDNVRKPAPRRRKWFRR